MYAATKSLKPITLRDTLLIKNVVLGAAKVTPTASLSGKCLTGGRLNVSGF